MNAKLFAAVGPSAKITGITGGSVPTTERILPRPERAGGGSIPIVQENGSWVADTAKVEVAFADLARQVADLRRQLPGATSADPPRVVTV